MHVRFQFLSHILMTFLISLNSNTTPIVRYPTIVENEYVSEDTIYSYVIGKLLWIRVNIYIDVDIPTGKEITIATLPSDVIPVIGTFPLIPNSKNTGTVMVSVNTNGTIALYKYTDDDCTGWIRGMIVIPIR